MLRAPLPTLAPLRLPRTGLLLLGVSAAILVATVWHGPSEVAAARWALVAEAGPLPWHLFGGGSTLTDYPLEAVVLLPLAGLGAAWLPVGVALWTTLAGFTAARLCGRWWGSGRAAVLGGVGWQAACLPALAAGEPTWLALLALLPLAWELLLRALTRRELVAFLAPAAPVTAMLLLSDGAVPWLLLLAAGALPLTLRGPRPAEAAAGLIGALGATLLLVSPVLALRWSATPTALTYGSPPLLPLLVLGIGGAWVGRRSPERLLPAALALLASLGHPAFAPVGALGAVVAASALGLIRRPTRRPQVVRSVPSSPTPIEASPANT